MLNNLWTVRNTAWGVSWCAKIKFDFLLYLLQDVVASFLSSRPWQWLRILSEETSFKILSPLTLVILWLNIFMKLLGWDDNDGCSYQSRSIICKFKQWCRLNLTNYNKNWIEREFKRKSVNPVLDVLTLLSSSTRK